MWVLAYVILGLLVIGAAALPCWPIVSAPGWQARRMLLAGLVSASIILVGGGFYFALGHPYLAVRSLTDVTARDYPGAIAALARLMSKNQKVREDPRGWLMLARGYEALGDRADANAALRQAIGLMVVALQNRLRLQSNDPEGWQRLIRSYVMLGQEDNARATIASARKALARNSAALRMLDAETKELKLQK